MKSKRNFMRTITLSLIACLLLATMAFASAETASGPLSVRAITDMGWWGQRVTGVVLEFAENVDASGLTAEDFKVRDTAFNPYFDTGDVNDPSFMRDQTVVDVFTVADPALLLEQDRPAEAGKYLVVMVEPNFNGGTKISVSGGMMANPNQPTEIILGKDIVSTDGKLLAISGDTALKLTDTAIVNRGIDQFIHAVMEDPSVGLPLNYDYRLPKDYDASKKYPLVVFFNGNGQGYFPEADNIRGQLICDGTVTFWFNEQNTPVSEDVIFLVPQSTRTGQSTAVQAEQAAELIERFSEEFAVDTSRVYAYSLSMGSSIEWWLAQYRSDLFAAIIQTSFMGNNQAQAEAIAAAELPVWMFQGQYDHLFGSADALASYQRIVDAYKARGLSDERIDELVRITVFPDSAFEPQGPGEHTPSGPRASLNPDLPGPRIDRHASLVPAFQDPATTEWLFAQKKSDVQTGPIVKEDAGSPTGYSVTFVYKNDTADAVRLAGDLTLLKVGDTEKTRYELENWETGMYHAGGVEFLRDMVKDENGYWTVTVPLHAGGLSYWYRVDDASKGWENKRLWDPASTKPRPAGTTSFRVLNNDVLDAVYVPYSEKQNDETLAQRAAYELPLYPISSRGTVQYVEYTNVLGEGGYYLGIYLPAGYSPFSQTTYKTLYLAHGMFGDETDWMVPGNAPNIMDHLIANGEIEPTIIVTMGNHFSPPTREGGKPAYDANNTAKNLVEVIIPFMESHYKVSTNPADRAYAGFSMGGMTGGAVLDSYGNQFGYFGFFSGSPRTDIAATAAKLTGKVPFIYLGNGCFESDISGLESIRDTFTQSGVTAVAAQTIGAHDMTTAGRLLVDFAKNYLWK